MGFVLLDNLGIVNSADYLSAKTSDCVVGYKAIFQDSNNEIASGTLINATGKSQTFDCQPATEQTRIVSKGYHNGSEQLKVNPISSTNSPNNGTTILTGKTAYISDGKGKIQFITGKAGR